MIIPSPAEVQIKVCMLMYYTLTTSVSVWAIRTDIMQPGWQLIGIETNQLSYTITIHQATLK